MALPTISHNTPSAGSISWTGFSIAYAGGSYNIAPGSTSNAYVWWLFNGGVSPALQSGNALPNLGPDDMILFLNKTGTGVLVPTAELLDGSLIVGGSILASAIGANQIQTSHLSANAVTADNIAANAVVAKHLAAGTVTADKLSVGTISDNMVVNGSFEDALSGTLVGWEVNAMTGGTISPVTGVASSGAVSMQMAATATTANLRFRQQTPQFIPVSAASGRRYYVAVRAGVSTALTTGFYFRVLWHDANKVQLTTGGFTDIRSNGSLTTTFTIYEGQAIPPATAKYMSFEILLVNPNVVTTVYVDEVIAHEVTMSAQIGDGQISAVKILANSITADRIQVGAITADRLLVSDRTNYWENPDFEIDTVGGIPKGTTNTNTTNSRIIAGGARGSGKALELNAFNGANNDVYSTNIFPVEPGDQYFIQYDYKFLNSLGTSAAGAGFRTYGPTKNALNWYNAAAVTARPTTWQEGENAMVGVYEVPAGVHFLQPWVTFANNGETTNRFHIDNLMIRRMNGGELIVDGAIIAAKIAADAITADKIATNAVTADAIAANAVVAESIAVNALNGKTITGATIQTAASGARIVLNATSLKGWDANNLNYLTADANGVSVTGTVSATGISKDWATNANVNIKATLGNKTARNTWVGYDFEQPGVYFEKDGVTQNTIDMPRLIAKYTDTMSAESAHVPVNAAGDLNIRHQSSFTAAPSGASLGSKKYDKRINEDGGAGVNGILSSASIISEPDSIVARAEDGANTYYGSWLMSLGATGMDGSSSYPGITQGAELGFRPGGNDPNQSKAYLKMDRPGVGGAQFDLYSSSGSDVVRVRSEGNTLNIDAPVFKLNGKDLSNGEVHTFTCTANINPSAIPVPRLQTFSYSAANSTTSSLATASTGYLTVTNTGVYDLHWSYNQSSPTSQSDRSFLEVKTDGQSIPLARTNFALTEDSCSTSVTGVRLTAGQKLYFEVYQHAGQTVVTNSIIRLKRVSAPTPTAGWESGNLTHEGNLTVNGNLTGKHRRWEGTTSGFEIAGNGIGWDTGPVTMDSNSAKTTDPGMCTPGPYAGSVTFNETGYYQISVWLVPRSGPGLGWLKLNVSTGETLGQVGNDSHMWESYLTTIPVYIQAGQYVRTSCSYGSYHLSDTRWKIVKVAT